MTAQKEKAAPAGTGDGSGNRAADGAEDTAATAKSKRAKRSRDKGGRIEREIVNTHRRFGIHAERVPLSGASHYQGNSADVDIFAFGKDEAPLIGEVKARKGGDGFKTLERWLGDYDCLFLRRDNADPLILLPARVWFTLLDRVQ